MLRNIKRGIFLFDYVAATWQISYEKLQFSSI